MMKQILLIACLLYISFDSLVKSTSTSYKIYDNVDDDDDYDNSTGVKDDDFYENENENEDDSTDYYDQDSSQESTHTEQKDPYNCPAQCKCVFKKVGSAPQDDYQDDDTYDYDSESIKLKKFRRKRRESTLIALTNSTNAPDSNDDSNDYDDLEVRSTTKSQLANLKNQISVDCSGQELNSIVDLFDYDFPVNQIISL